MVSPRSFAKLSLAIAAPVLAMGRTGVRARHDLAAPISREGFIREIPTDDTLEIGPYCNPALRGPGVRYFDLFPTEETRARALREGLDSSGAVPIHYSSPVGDLSVVDRQFASAFSSHAIEHQPDLVRHLSLVAGVLKPGGRYFLAVPDARYCFDHHRPRSTLEQVKAATGRRVHTRDTVLAHLLQQTHNDPLKHWLGLHGPRNAKTVDPAFAEAEAARASAGEYVDVHAWTFAPENFSTIVSGLTAATGLEVERVYDTAAGELEFFAVLRKTAAENR